MTIDTSPAQDSLGATRIDTSDSRWQHLFWRIGGFDPKTLSQEHCRAIRSKYTTMGALVLLTALLASCSGGYAIFTIFKDPIATVAMGALWGAMILTLDRFLVSSTRKAATPKNFNENPNALPPFARRNSWLPLALRLPLAIMIGLVVAVPIEVRLMKPLVDEDERAQVEEQQKETESNRTLIRLRGESDDLAARSKEKSKEVARRKWEAAQEADGTGGSKRYGPKENFQIKDGYRKSAEGELNRINKLLDNKNKEVSDELARLSRTIADHSTARSKGRSVISDLIIIGKLAADPHEAGRAVRIVSAFLTLFFVLIECIPVLAKAISPFDPYDATLQEIEYSGILDSLVEARRRYAEASLSEEDDPEKRPGQ